MTAMSPKYSPVERRTAPNRPFALNRPPAQTTVLHYRTGLAKITDLLESAA